MIARYCKGIPGTECLRLHSNLVRRGPVEEEVDGQSNSGLLSTLLLLLPQQLHSHRLVGIKYRSTYGYLHVEAREIDVAYFEVSPLVDEQTQGGVRLAQMALIPSTVLLEHLEIAARSQSCYDHEP